MYSSSVGSKIPATTAWTQSPGAVHHQLDLRNPDMGPRVSFSTAPSCSMNLTVDFTHGPWLQIDDLWAAHSPPSPFLGYASPWLGQKAWRTLPIIGSTLRNLRFLPPPQSSKFFGTGVVNRVRGVSVGITFSLDLHQNKSGQ